jgi:hypothetical protein
MIRPRLCAVLSTTTTIILADGAINMLTPEEQVAGWKLLFDGKTAPGLRGLQKRDFLTADGRWIMARLVPKDRSAERQYHRGDLVTAEQFADFEFKFDFKLRRPSALSGILMAFAREMWVKSRPGTSIRLLTMCTIQRG